jgi:hypothetical protein
VRRTKFEEGALENDSTSKLTLGREGDGNSEFLPQSSRVSSPDYHSPRIFQRSLKTEASPT